jgi:hypothetical protein
MDTIRLRTSSSRFNEFFKYNNKPTIIHKISDLFQLDNEEFIWEAYKQALLREPEKTGFQDHLQQLQAGKLKLNILDGILQSEEAQRLYAKPVIDTDPSNEFSLAKLLHNLYHANGLELIQTLYREFLNRNSDFEGLRHNLHLLNTGTSCTSLISGFLLSRECRKLLRDIKYPEIVTTSSNYPVKHIGIFLGYDHKVILAGEGIGSFIIRLVKGLLLNRTVI